MIAAVPGLEVALALRARLADLYWAYDDALNGGELERWAAMFVEDCVYRVTSRENDERGMPIAVVYCESRAMLEDRVVALRQTSVYVPRIARRMTGGVCVREVGAEGMRLTADFVVFQTMPNQPSAVFLCGRTRDRVVEEGGVLRFAERVCVYDSTIIPTSLVYPI
jgi:3-phenylpropionate/cinnamic acid dioxygenase small subunit